MFMDAWNPLPEKYRNVGVLSVSLSVLRLVLLTYPPGHILISKSSASWDSARQHEQADQETSTRAVGRPDR
jgi:hypothetical protein